MRRHLRLPLLVGSGTTAKQLNNEKDAQPIAYGGMLIECVLAIVSCALLRTSGKITRLVRPSP
ncbi:MAG: carbon starvation CstA family protein [Oscillospiraceae bacterium]